MFDVFMWLKFDEYQSLFENDNNTHAKVIFCARVGLVGKYDLLSWRFEDNSGNVAADVVFETVEAKALFGMQWSQIHPSVTYLSKKSKHIKRANQLKHIYYRAPCQGTRRAVKPLTRGPQK